MGSPQFSIVKPQGGQMVTQPSRQAAAQQTFVRESDLQSPSTMARVLNNFLKETGSMTAASRALPFLSGVLFQGLPFYQQAPQLLSHQLGKPYQGYWIVRAQNVNTIIATGTTPPPVTVSGSLVPGVNMAYELVIAILAPGAIGTATFKYSLNGGGTYSSTLSTAASVALGNTGLTALFPPGTYAANNVYTLVLPPGSAAPALFELALPAGASASQSINLQCTTNAVLDIVIF